MKLLTYAINKKELTGVLNREGTFVYPLSAAGMEYRTMKEVIREIGPSELELLDHISGLPPYEVSNAAPLEDIKIMAPIPVPDQDIICLGINYLAHAEESARFKKEAFSKPDQAVYFSKRVNRATDPGDGIPSHKELTSQLDYEAELAVILKKDAKDVALEDVEDYIFGYTIMNDVSAREVQTAHRQVVFREEPGWIYAPGALDRHRRQRGISAEAQDPVPCQRRAAPGFQHGTVHSRDRRSGQ